MVLNCEDLVKDLHVTNAGIEYMKTTGTRMSFLKPMREARSQSIVANRCIHAEKLEKNHYKTFHFLELMNRGKKGGFIKFMEELNGPIPCKEIKSDSGEKEEIILGCEGGNDDSVFQDSPRAKEESLMLEDSEKAKQKQDVRERVASTDRTYYSILGVKIGASMHEITTAYRNLSLLFHPDKCTDTDATSIFQKLNEAKETLHCQVKRAVYDKRIRANAS
jgi:DnaJ domain